MAGDSLCVSCKVLDNTPHVLNDCSEHEEAREKLKLRLNHPGKITELLNCTDMETANALADLLVIIDDDRREGKRKREEKEKEQESAGRAQK